jgi:hypothetical protein
MSQAEFRSLATCRRKTPIGAAIGFAALMLTGVPALAQEASTTSGGLSVRVLTAQFQGKDAHPECFCRALGRTHRLGTEICLGSNGPSQVFRCGMDLNVTSWKPMGKPCPLS